MGYTIKQKIDICLKAESNPDMTQSDLAEWAQIEFHSDKKPSQTTISRILSSKNDLIASKQTDFKLVRRRKRLNPILRQILTEWVTQSIWENIPITTPIIQSTANSIWTRLPLEVKDGNGIFNQKWCNQFVKDLHVDLTGDDQDILNNFGYKLNKIWSLDEKLELKKYLSNLIHAGDYKPQDIFTIEEFQLFYSLPLDQIFDINSIDKGLKQSSSSTENSLTIMLGSNLDGSEKLTPLIVGKHDKFDVSKSSYNSLKNFQNHYSGGENSLHAYVNLMNKITETYNIFYKNNINKWITSTMFQNYLLTLEHKLANNSPKRKILIILDDSSTHRILNLKFNNIKLIYLKNNTSHKSNFNSLVNGVNFDYCPMNFGIVYEFKILYRLQQYLDMINKQKKNHSSNQPSATSMNYKIEANSATTDVLSEPDYIVPLVRSIEWIKRAWDSISSEKILYAWHKTHLINIRSTWPQNQNLVTKVNMLRGYSFDKSYKKLENIMLQLNVVLPWTTDELLGLVNERSKATINYISIEEIITSCLLESHFLHEEEEEAKIKKSKSDNWVMSQMLNPSMTGFNDIDLLDDEINMEQNSMADSSTDLALPPPASDIASLMAPQSQISNLLSTSLPGVTQIPPIPSVSETPQLANTFDIELPRRDSVSSVALSSKVHTPGYKIDIPNESMFSISALLAAADEVKHNAETPPPDSLRVLSNIPNKAQTQLLKHKLTSEEHGDTKRRSLFVPSTSPIHLNDSLPSSVSSSPYLQPLAFPKVYSGITFKSPSTSNLQNYSKNFDERELMKLLIRLMEASKVGYLQISKETYKELKSNLRMLQHKVEKEAGLHTEHK